MRTALPAMATRIMRRPRANPMLRRVSMGPMVMGLLRVLRTARLRIL